MIVPAVVVTVLHSEGQTVKLLILSQVVLSFQLPFAVVPLIQVTASKKKMGALASPLRLTLFASVIAMIIIALNIKLLYDIVLG